MKPQAGSVPLGPILKKIVPLCFITGMAMEAFMVNTGFCKLRRVHCVVKPTGCIVECETLMLVALTFLMRLMLRIR